MARFPSREPRPMERGTVYFYELHEGDEDLFADLILVHPDELDPEEFFELVQTARRRVQDSFEQDTLIEAIAEELEREHGFTFVSDSRLTAAVNVSMDEDENRLARVGDDEADEDDDDLDDEGDFRTVVAEFHPDAGNPN